jgi:predicted nucleic acid-binding protein
MAERLTLDTNILVYAVDRDAGPKHTRAVEVVDHCVDLDCVLTLQALAEFYFVVTRKDRMPPDEAAAQVEDWLALFPVVTPRAGTLRRAIGGSREHGIAFWDAMIWAVAAENGVTVLLTEDGRPGLVVGGVRWLNPFTDPGWP